MAEEINYERRRLRRRNLLGLRDDKEPNEVVLEKRP